MLVIHGLWAYGAVYLWAEDSALPATAPPGPGRRSRAPRPHPFALPASGLARALTELPEPAAGLAGQGVDDELTLWLPSGAAGPLASPELIRPPGPGGPGLGSSGLARSGPGSPKLGSPKPGGLGPGGSGPGQPGSRRVPLAAWRVPALAFEAAAAVDLLAVLDEPGAFSAEVMGGGSARYLAAVVRLAADLPARGRLLPALRSEDGGRAARWRPVLSGADAERASELAAGMPALCRATEAGGQSSAEILTGALEALADAAARARLAGQPLLQPRKGRRPARIPVAERWIAALTSADAEVEVGTAEDEQEAAELAAQLDAWHRAAQLPAGPVRTCFRLVEPEPAEDSPEPDAVSDVAEPVPPGAAGSGPPAAAEPVSAGAGGRVPRAAAEPVSPGAGGRVPPGVAEPGPPGGSGDGDGGAGAPDEDWLVEFALQSTDDPSLMMPAADVWAGASTAGLAAGIQHPEEELLAGLGRAVRLFPELDRALRTAAPAEVRMGTEGAFGFLRQAAPLLSGAGFGVLLPDWVRKSRLGLKLTTRSRQTSSGSVTDPKFGLNDLVEFRYDLAIGDQELDPEELDELARLKVPLVRLRGQWVELDDRHLRAALRFLERSRSGTMRASDALQAGLHGADDDLPLVDVDADGWLGDLLSGQADHRLEPVATPASFTGTLRPYQERGVAWLSFLGRLGLGSVLADDMGLGKGVTTLCLVAHDKEMTSRSGNAAARSTPSLLVCPMSVVGNWEREAARFTPELKVHVHHGSDRLRGDALTEALSGADLVITSYGIATRDRDELARVEWARVACDEAQNIKNHATRQAQAVRGLPAGSRIALTGTPVENRLSDLWSIMEFTNPGLLGPAERFRQRYAIPIERAADEEATARLRRITGPFILRRLKTDKSIISDLPDKLEMKVWCNLTAEQASLYQATVTDMLARIEGAEEGIERRGLVLATMAKLKQVCNHPAHLLGDGSRLPGRSGKLARLEEICDEVIAEGDKALCFTQYAEFGAMLQPHLAARLGCPVLYLHGGTPKKQRDAMVAAFQEMAEPALFLLSLKAGGTGLNLTAASHVIHVDRWWNPAVEDQATDRAFRIGQRRDVQVRKFVCVGTLEERIDAMIEEKKALAERIVGTGEAWLTELSVAELRKVIELSPEAVSE
jgi:SNF2 family DNA or RNA helicase